MANSKSVAAAGNATSDIITPDADAVAATLMVKADNDGTPAADDDIEVYLLITTGDPDADPDSADEYTTTGHAGAPRAILETDVEDPAISGAIPIPLPIGGLKVYCDNQSAGRAITVSGQINEIDVNGNLTERQVTWT